MPRWPGSAPPPSARRRSRERHGTGLRLTRRRGLLAAALLAAGCAKAEGAPLATPLVLGALPAGHPLRLLGGLEIDRASLGFGGLSALHLAPDLTMTVLSDLGRFAELRLEVDAGLRPSGLALLRRGVLGDEAGRPLPRGPSSDAESLARLPDGSWLVGFERWHRIRRYRDLAGPGLPVEAPPGLQQAPVNGGLETLAVLPDGRWLALTEALPAGEGITRGWIGGPNDVQPGAWQPIAWRAAPEFMPVDAAALPDGSLLVLERAFSVVGGFRARLVRLPAAALAGAAPDAVLAGDLLVELADPLPPENWEGVAVTRHAGRQLVALVSDDNERSWQRSLFLLFELRD
jgi:hypothetical protein